MERRNCPANIGAARRSLLLKGYLLSSARLKKLHPISQACLNGFWLGALTREDLHVIDRMYFEERLCREYRNDQYNQRGLREWEREMLEKYFHGCASLLVTGAGGGREVLALRKLGFAADGFDCDPLLVEYANNLLERERFIPNIQLVPRDHCPDTGRKYDGLIVGWGSFMLIQGRKQRIAFLKRLHAQAHVASPILLSFFTRTGNGLYLKTSKTIGNTLRRMLKREALTLGDDLIPHYVHHFNEEDVAAELTAAGFQLKYYSTNLYGHAVGISC